MSFGIASMNAHRYIGERESKALSHRRRIGEVVIIDGGHGRAVVSAGIQLLSPPPSSSPLPSLKRMARLVERR